MTSEAPGTVLFGGDVRLRRFVTRVGLALGLATFVWLFPGLDTVGVSWDEPRYFWSVTRIQDWIGGVVTGPDRVELLTEESIRETWDWARYWNPHPPAYKIAMAATEATFGRWTGSIVGFRIASLGCFALLVGMVAWLAGLAWGRVAAVGAGLSLMFMPRVAGHAHFGATDMPLTLAWFAATAGLALFVVYGRRRYLVAGSTALGLALATKFTGWLIPISLVLWLGFFGRSRRGVIGTLIWGCAGLLVAWAINPLAWHDPIGETTLLFSDSLYREELVPIYTYYMGKVWGFQVPAHHAIVMTAITVPLPLLVLGTGGFLRVLRALPRQAVGTLAITQIIFFLALMAAPTSPNHDGIRLFLPMFPYVALLAGCGFAWVWERASGSKSTDRSLLIGLVLGVLFFVPPYVQTVRVAPLHLSYYNEVVGGARGAARAGMEATYWLEAVTPDFLERVNETLPHGASLTAHPNTSHYKYLQSYGMLREDIEVTEDWPPDYLLLVARKSTFRPQDWRIYLNVRPELMVELEGVELAGLYEWSPDVTPEPDTEEP